MTRPIAVVCFALLIFGIAACDDDNVHSAPVCSIEPCGGDPVGEWTIESACVVEEDCSSESGTVSGWYTFDATGYSYEWLIETSGCGGRGESESGGGGSYRAEGNFLYRGTGDETIFEYCVDGDLMQLHDLDPNGGESFTLKRMTP